MSKTLLVLMVGMLAVGCDTTPTMKSVAGTYEHKEDGVVSRVVLLDDGIIEAYRDGKNDGEGKWKIINKEIHAESGDDGIVILMINTDGSLTFIAIIDVDGKREEAPKEKRTTWIKIK